MPDEIRATPRNQLLGLLADAVQSGSDFASRPFGYDNPPVRGLLDLMGVPAVANTLKELSYGGALGTGSGMTWRPKADTVDAAMAVAPLVAAMPRAINTTAAAIGQKLEPGVNALVNRAMQQGGLSADILQAMSNKTISPAIVWHGSPHKFDRFDSSKIGTGEGAQAYGHGLYLAESPEVAKTYKEALSGSSKNKFLLDGNEFGTVGGNPEWMNFNKIASEKGYSTEAQALAYHKLREHGGNIDAASADLGWADNPSQWHGEAADILRKVQYKPEGGSLYKIDLPDEHIAKMLDWDKPLSKQHPDVQKVIRNSDIKGLYGTKDSPKDWEDLGLSPPDLRGSEIVNKLAEKLSSKQFYSDSAAASNWLREQGIPGIRYLDGGSRGAGAGTSNFVVFPGNEDMLTILERNGKPVGLLN